MYHEVAQRRDTCPAHRLLKSRVLTKRREGTEGIEQRRCDVAPERREGTGTLSVVGRGPPYTFVMSERQGQGGQRAKQRGEEEVE